MKNRLEMRVFTMLLVMAAVVLLAGASAKSQQNNRIGAIGNFEFKAAGAPAGMQSAAMNAEHTELLKLAGDYDRTVKFLGQTGAMAAPSKGTCTITVVLGGRFLMEESHDTVFGKPVDGLRIYGYNDATKQYEMARMYTMSNAITLMKGKSSDGGKTIDYAGGTAGMGNATLHSKLERVNDDEFTVTMSATDANGKDAPFQETIYTRKK